MVAENSYILKDRCGRHITDDHETFVGELK